MQVPANISAPDIDLSSAQRESIAKHVAKLESIYNRLTRCRVTVEVPHRTPEGRPTAYAVRIDVTVPQSELVVDQQSAESIATAIDQAFDVAERRLRDYVERRRARART